MPDLHLWREVHKCISKNFQIALNSNVQMETLKFDSLVIKGDIRCELKSTGLGWLAHLGSWVVACNPRMIVDASSNSPDSCVKLL